MVPHTQSCVQYGYADKSCLYGFDTLPSCRRGKPSALTVAKEADEDVRAWLANEILSAQEELRAAKTDTAMLAAKVKTDTLIEVRTMIAVLGLTIR